MPKLAAFPKAFMQALCKDGSMTVEEWISLAAGLDIDSSSASDLETDSIISGELNRLTGLYRGNIRSTDSRAQAEQSRAGAKNAKTAGYFNTASTFLSGASNTYYSYERIKTNPRFED